MNFTKIERITAREILDSRGNPTVEASIVLSDGTHSCASVPSGASTGSYEAHELRDKDPNRYHGKGVLKAVQNVNETIAKTFEGNRCLSQQRFDRELCELDGTENKTVLGANAILAVSLAYAKACASHYNIPLYRYLGGINAAKLPVPMMNILNGGAHAANNIDIQEFMIVPVGASSFSKAVQMCCEIYHNLGKKIKADGLSSGVGDEGGYAPSLESDAAALDYILAAIKDSGYNEDSVKLALDVASTEWKQENNYILPKRGIEFSNEALTEYYSALLGKYPIISIEDGLSEDDFDGWVKMTEKLGEKINLVGDDFFVTNKKRLAQGIRQKCANAILIKPNQIGTLSETLDVIQLAKQNHYRVILSHRSGETADTTIADIAVAVGADFIKTGAPCRSERTEKYNRLIKIESELFAPIYG